MWRCILKVKVYYFTFMLYTFLFLSGIVIEDIIAKYYIVSPILLRAACVVKVGRVLRLVKFLLQSKGLSTLFSVLAMSLPDLINICLLHFLIMFVYAIFGMFCFMNVRHRAAIDQDFNFETFGQSMILLIQISNTDGWDVVLAAIMNEDDCYLGEDGDCGSRSMAVAYLVSYLTISFVIIIMYIAILLDNHRQAMEEVEEGLTKDDFDMFYETWENFDPDGTQFISYSDLTTFLDSLKEPLRIPKPNEYKITSMDIPICKGDLVFCVDILDALTKNFFQKKGLKIQELPEQKIVPKDVAGYNPVSSTLNRQHETFSPGVTQLAW